jgi:single-stranded DNA-binding protein
LPGRKVAGNRIELDGRVVGEAEVRVTPRGTPVLRFVVDCSAPGEDLRLGVVMTGDLALGAKGILQPGRLVKVSGRLRALKAGGTINPDAAYEVIAASVEGLDS